MELVLTRADDPVALTLLAAYERDLAGFGIVLDVDEGGSVDVDEMVPPSGSFYVVRVDGRPVACGGMRRLDEETAEVKRMYVDPAARGRGVARALLGRLEDDARTLGCRSVRLDTGPGMAAALGLYRAAGYTEIGDYNANPHAAYWLEKSLPG